MVILCGHSWLLTERRVTPPIHISLTHTQRQPRKAIRPIKLALLLLHHPKYNNILMYTSP